jgi:hypothetical protein
MCGSLHDMMTHSRSCPMPLLSRKSSSCLFLSAMVFFITVFIRTLNISGACAMLSPAPMEVMADTRLTLCFFMALIMHLQTIRTTESDMTRWYFCSACVQMTSKYSKKLKPSDCTSNTRKMLGSVITGVIHIPSLAPPPKCCQTHTYHTPRSPGAVLKHGGPHVLGPTAEGDDDTLDIIIRKNFVDICLIGDTSLIYF